MGTFHDLRNNESKRRILLEKLDSKCGANFFMSLLTVAKSCQRQLISKIPQPNQVPNFSINLGVTHLCQDCRRGAGEKKTEHLRKGGCNSGPKGHSWTPRHHLKRFHLEGANTAAIWMNLIEFQKSVWPFLDIFLASDTPG